MSCDDKRKTGQVFKTKQNKQPMITQQSSCWSFENTFFFQGNEWPFLGHILSLIPRLNYLLHDERLRTFLSLFLLILKRKKKIKVKHIGFTSYFARKSFILLFNRNSQATPLGVSTTSVIAALWCSKPSFKAFDNGQRNAANKKLNCNEKKYRTI